MSETQLLDPSALSEGMTIAADVYTKNGMFLVPKGAKLSKGMINRIRKIATVDPIPDMIQIVTGTFISIMLFLLAKPIINFIFTEEYSRSIEVLRLLSPIPFFRSINFALGAALMSAQRQQRRTRVQISAAIFNVLGNLLVIIPFGIHGVAVVYVISELFLSVGYTLLVRDLQKQLHLA